MVTHFDNSRKKGPSCKSFAVLSLGTMGIFS
jgi:hypothetical protein